MKLEPSIVWYTKIMPIIIKNQNAEIHGCLSRKINKYTVELRSHSLKNLTALVSDECILCAISLNTH